MKLFPAIDLFEGQAVRLYKGDYSKKTVYSDDPVRTAEYFKNLGARYIHLVDLEGAKSGTTPNFSIIEEIIKKTNLKAEIGGGIRNKKVVEKYLNAGAMRVILGTAAVENPKFLKEMVALYGDRIAVGVDIKNGYVATHGWTECSNKTGAEFFEQLQDIGVSAVICTDISKDGVLKGPNTELYKSLYNKFPSIEIVASGGVSNVEDIIALNEENIPSAILGKAVYEGKINLDEVFHLFKQEDL